MNFNFISNLNLKSLVLAALIPLFGCGLKFGEKVKSTEVVEFKSGSCLSESNKITKSFFKGEAAEYKVGEAVDCYSRVIETFRDNVRGEKSNEFSPEEIRTFLRNNFLKDSEFDLTTELVQELMKLKVVIAGGSRFRVTHDELSTLSMALLEAKADIVAFNPVMPIVVGWDNIDSYSVLAENARLQAEFTVKGQIFTDNLVKLAKIFKFSHLNYQVDELYELVLQVLKSNHSEAKTIEQFQDLKPLFVTVSKALIDDRQILDASSWPKLLKALGSGYMAYRRYDLLVKGSETENLGLDELTMERIVADLQPTLAVLLLEKPSHKITGSEIRDLLTQSKIVFTEKFMDKPDLAKWIQKILDLNSYNQLMALLWSHILNEPVQRLRGESTNELDIVAVSTIANELAYLFRSQSHVLRMFETFRLQGQSATRSEIMAYLQNIIDHHNEAQFDVSDYRFALEQIQMFNSPGIFAFDENNFLKIFDESNLSPDSVYAVTDIEKSNYSRAGARLSIHAFSRDLESALFIKVAEKQDVYDGWELARPIVVELDFIQPDNLTFISSRFREADLFISSSNGDDIAQFAEIHDIILHIYSGKNRSDVLRIDLVNKILPGTDPESYKPKDTISEIPLIDFYVTALNGFQAIPKYQELVTTQPAKMPLFALSLLKAVGHVETPEKLVKFEDVDLYPHVAQYIEMLFFKFDTNRDGILDKFEGANAYPTYEKTVVEVLEKLGVGSVFQPERRLPIFLYLLKMGRFYKGKEEFKEFTKFINDQRDFATTDKWEISSNRIVLGNLFNFLADNLNKVKDEIRKP